MNELSAMVVEAMSEDEVRGAFNGSTNWVWAARSWLSNCSWNTAVVSP